MVASCFIMYIGGLGVPRYSTHVQKRDAVAFLRNGPMPLHRVFVYFAR